MSRYESSRFVRDPKVMNKEVLAQACEKLGWKYVLQGDDLLVTDLGGKERLHGEFALKLSGGTVTYNSYYLKNGQELVEELKAVFFPLNVEYARNSVIRSFSAQGFTYKKEGLLVPSHGGGRGPLQHGRLHRTPR